MSPISPRPIHPDEELAICKQSPLVRVKSALYHHPRLPERRAETPKWDDSLLEPSAISAQASCERLTFEDLGYVSHQLNLAVHERLNSIALLGPFPLLTKEGVNRLQEVVADLESRHRQAIHARKDAPIVTVRLRAADSYSQCLYDLVRSERLTAIVARAVGAPVMPHPHRDARVQINYYKGADSSAARWHRDGMNVVVNILLNDLSGSAGGSYVVNGSSGQWRTRCAPYDDVELVEVPLRDAGYALITRGNRIDHCVTPLRIGTRVTLSISFYVLGAGRHDANRIRHSAPDDGLMRTFRTWRQFRWPARSDSSLRHLLTGLDERR
jgi:hypothetical protein